MSEFAEKVRSIGHLKHKGTSHRKVVRREDNGQIAGVEIEHWDDRQDAVATPDTARFKVNLTGRDA